MLIIVMVLVIAMVLLWIQIVKLVIVIIRVVVSNSNNNNSARKSKNWKPTSRNGEMIAERLKSKKSKPKSSKQFLRLLGFILCLTDMNESIIKSFILGISFASTVTLNCGYVCSRYSLNCLKVSVFPSSCYPYSAQWTCRHWFVKWIWVLLSLVSYSELDVRRYPS